MLILALIDGLHTAKRQRHPFFRQKPYLSKFPIVVVADLQDTFHVLTVLLKTTLVDDLDSFSQSISMVCVNSC